ncbi:hypothetical protein CCP1ISM_8130001 [Azospirillaceae bacterium]
MRPTVAGPPGIDRRPLALSGSGSGRVMRAAAPIQRAAAVPDSDATSAQNNQSTSSPSTQTAATAPPPDLAALTEQVYRLLVERIGSERARRGM